MNECFTCDCNCDERIPQRIICTASHHNIYMCWNCKTLCCERDSVPEPAPAPQYPQMLVSTIGSSTVITPAVSRRPAAVPADHRPYSVVYLLRLRV